MLGPLSATITAKGKGFDPKIATATFEGIVHSALVKQYNYCDLKMKGNIADQKEYYAAIRIHYSLCFKCNR
jgi:hypothetical protein